MHAEERYKALEEYPTHLVNIARQHLEIIHPLLNARPLTRALVRQRVLEVKAGLNGHLTGESVPPVSIASIYRWIQAYKRSGGDVRSLIPRVRRGEDGPESRLNPALEEIIEAVIREMYWTREQVTIDTIQRALAQHLHEINSSLLECEQLRLPSRSTIYRRIRAWIARQGEVELLRSDRMAQPPLKGVLERSFHLTAQRLADPGWAQEQLLTHPNQRVECIYIPLDLLVIDDDDHLPLGRLALVFLLDCYSGYITGWALSFEPPSPSAVLEGLFAAIMEKDDIRQQFRTKHDYLGYGVPEILVTDQAMAHGDPRLQRVCRHLGIDLRYEPTSISPLKDALEHSLRTFLVVRGSVIDVASCFPFQVQESGNSQATLCVTLNALRYTLYHWIVDVYTQEAHPALGESRRESDIPAVLWQQALSRGFIPRRVLSPGTLASLLLSRTIERRMQHDGIIFEHLRYHPIALPSLFYVYCPLQPGTAVEVTFYPQDLSDIWAYDPRSGTLFYLCPEDQAYTAHLSLWKHRIIRRYARSLATSSAENIDILLSQAKTRLQERTAAVLQTSVGAAPFRSEQSRLDRLTIGWIGEVPLWQGASLCETPEPCPHQAQVWTGGHHFSERSSTMTDGSHDQVTLLDPRQWRTMTDYERYSHLDCLQIAHPRLKALIREVDSCASFTPQVHPGTPQCLAILGETGVGKTTFIQSWIQTATQRLSLSSTEVPVIPYVYFALPSPASSKGILASCLSALGDPHPAQGEEWVMMERLVRASRASSVRLLIVDEFQHLLNRETQRVRHACVELLEHIIKQTKIPAVFVGSQWETEAILRASTHLEQLVGAPRILRPFEWDRNRPETLLEFRALMRAIDHHLPFDPSGLEEEEMAYGFFLSSDGILGWIMKLITYAAREAIAMQAATLSRSLFAAAYEACIAHTTMGVGKMNPFAMPNSLQEENRVRILGNKSFSLAQKRQRKRMANTLEARAEERKQEE